MSKLCFAMMSHQGVERKTNDDKVFAAPEQNLWVLSDGVGGLAQGEQASQFVIDEVDKSIRKGLKLKSAVHSAHSVIKAYNNHEKEDRGATVVALQHFGTAYQIAWVGDSRAYLWSAEAQTLEQLTEDHTLVQKLINAGLLAPEKAHDHPQKHVITQCLGVENEHQLDIGLLQRDWQFSESVLICSDGLYEELTEEQMMACLNKHSDRQAAIKEMIDWACEHGGKDNLSVIIVDSPVLEPQGSAGESLIQKFCAWIMRRQKR